MADPARKQLAEFCAKENAMRLTGFAWDELKPSVRLTLLQDADANIAAMFDHPELVRRALDERGGGVQIHIDTRPAEDDAFARGRRVGYEEGRRSR